MRNLFLLSISLIIGLACTSGGGDKEKPQPAPRIPPPLDPGDTPSLPPPAPTQPGWVSFARFESDQLAYLAQINENDRLNTVFLSMCEQLNEGKTNIKPFTYAANKAINSISSDRILTNSTATGDTGCARAVDLRDYGLTTAEWDLIVDNNPFGRTFESFTARGLLVKQLTQNAQAWLPAHVFAFTVFDAAVYPVLLNLPDTLIQLQEDLGIDLQDNFDTEDRDTFLVGHTGSPIAIGKPRMHLRTESADGFYYQSYDVVVASVGQADKNIFQSPFPVEARSDNTLIPDGHEVIFSLPNRLLGFYLADGAGFRQDFAPLDLVVDTEASALALDPTIRYLSCYRCHAQGIIPRTDEVFEKVSRDNAFDTDDVQKSSFWHGRPAGLDASMRADNAIFNRSLDDMAIGVNEPDHINAYTDLLRQESDINQIASLMFMRNDEFEDRLRNTITSLNQIGEVLDGNKASFEQLQTTLEIFVVEANVFRDDFGE